MSTHDSDKAAKTSHHETDKEAKDKEAKGGKKGTKKYVMTQSRYLNGAYVKASPEFPVVIEVDEDVKPGPDMRDASEAHEGLKTVYASKHSHPQLTEAEAQPFDATEKRASGQQDKIEYRPESKGADDSIPKGHRASEKKVI